MHTHRYLGYIIIYSLHIYYVNTIFMLDAIYRFGSTKKFIQNLHLIK